MKRTAAANRHETEMNDARVPPRPGHWSSGVEGNLTGSVSPGGSRRLHFVSVGNRSGGDPALPGETATRGLLRQLRTGIGRGHAVLTDDAILSVRAPGIKLVLARRIIIGAMRGGDVGGRCDARGSHQHGGGQTGQNSGFFHAPILSRTMPGAKCRTYK